MFSLVVRRLAARLLRRRSIGALAVLGAVGAAVAVWQLGLGVTTAPQMVGAPTAAEEYLRGHQSYDARLVWSTYSTEAQGRLAARGVTLQALEQQLRAAQEQGIRVEEIRYVGGQAVGGGQSMHFYLVRLRTALSRNQSEDVPYVFTLDTTGKIARVQ